MGSAIRIEIGAFGVASEAFVGQDGFAGVDAAEVGLDDSREVGSVDGGLARVELVEVDDEHANLGIALSCFDLAADMDDNGAFRRNAAVEGCFFVKQPRKSIYSAIERGIFKNFRGYDTIPGGDEVDTFSSGARYPVGSRIENCGRASYRAGEIRGRILSGYYRIIFLKKIWIGEVMEISVACYYM